MATSLELSLMALDVYADPSNPDVELRQHAAPQGWTAENVGQSYQPIDTGFYAKVYSKGSEVVIAYRGSSSLFEAATDGAVIASGTPITQLLDAYNFCLEVVSSGVSPSNISFTRHSLGGGPRLGAQNIDFSYFSARGAAEDRRLREEELDQLLH